jgi:hypothetical protein
MMAKRLGEVPVSAAEMVVQNYIEGFRKILLISVVLWITSKHSGFRNWLVHVIEGSCARVVCQKE